MKPVENSKFAAMKAQRTKPRNKPRLIAALANAVDGCTVEELENASGVCSNSIRPILLELLKQNIVTRNEAFRPTKTGCPSTVWYLATAA